MSTSSARPPSKPSAPLQLRRRLKRRLFFVLWAVVLATVATACTPAQRNVAAYLLADASGALKPADLSVTGVISGTVTNAEEPLAGATVVVADRIGTPFSAITDASGRYRIEGVPVGSYVVAGVAPGHAEGQTRTAAARPEAVTVTADRIAEAPPLRLEPLDVTPLPADLAASLHLSRTHTYTATSAFPPDAVARVTAYAFARNGVLNDSLRLYTPVDATPATALPLLFAVYPGTVDGWEPVSVSLAAQGYALVAVAPIGAWELDVEQHTTDALVALTLARQGALDATLEDTPPVALGGSFSSAILHRLLRQEEGAFGKGAFAGWVTVGGIADAFQGAAAFYTGAIQVPESYRFAIPALGNPNRNPVAFLRYSPVYSASSLPATLIIHTSADEIIPIEQAYALEAALHAAGVPVETFYYEDVSHYLQIDENMTAAGREMFFRVLEFIESLSQTAP